MPRDLTIKDHLFESHLFLGRAVAILVFSGILVLALLSRLIYLQIVAHEHFTTLSDDNRVKIVPEPPNRGLIYDRSGILLADNLPSYRLEITPEQVKDMEATLEAIEQLVEVRDIDRKRFENLRARKPRFQAIPLRFHLSDEEVARFAVQRHRLPGVEIQAGLSRHYPHGKLGVHALGYVGRIDEKDLQKVDSSNYSATTHIGKVGVEKSYEDFMHGAVGYRQVETNAQGRIIRVLERTAPSPGLDLYLTLDTHLQAVAEQAFGSFSGSAIAMDPQNGDILAFVSLPTYDPNPFVNGIEVKDYRALQEDEAQPLFNRALRGQYPPGSTIKPFVALGALEQGIVSDQASTYCPGFYTLPGKARKYRDWKRNGHGSVALRNALIESCDVYFYDLALSMGIDRIYSYLGHFGLGVRTGIDISGELPGLLPSREWKQAARGEPWFPGETLITGIGQGFTLTTPLQLATATAALANDGRRIRPRIVFAQQAPDGDSLIPIESSSLKAVPIQQYQHWTTIIEAMTAVVHGTKGTARRIGQDLKYRIAGKTGTAQVFGLKEEEKYDAEAIAEKLRDHALFIAFAPVENPRIVVAVVVENGGSGGAIAAPIARKILDQYLLDPKQRTAEKPPE